MRLYSDWASWWPLLSPPSHYLEEADWILPRLPKGDGHRLSLLELGAGGGSLAYHLKEDYRLTLTDVSPQMQAVSAKVNPEAEHLIGDMRTLRLGRHFDIVLIHDAISYMTTAADLRSALETAGVHCRPGGTLMAIPDDVTETFSPDHSAGGEDGSEGRGLRYLEWTYDPDPTDDHHETIYALLLRAADGTVRVEMDRHRLGLFSRDQWLEWLTDAGFDANVEVDPWGRHVFVATKRGT